VVLGTEGRQRTWLKARGFRNLWARGFKNLSRVVSGTKGRGNRNRARDFLSENQRLNKPLIRLNFLTFLYLTESLLTVLRLETATEKHRLLGATPPPARGLRPPRPASRSSHPASPKMRRPSRPTSYTKKKISGKPSKSAPRPALVWLFEKKRLPASREILSDFASG
jgi:hypothetical protein